MSCIICKWCDEPVDLDFNVEHEDECQYNPHAECEEGVECKRPVADREAWAAEIHRIGEEEDADMPEWLRQINRDLRDIQICCEDNHIDPEDAYEAYSRGECEILRGEECDDG